MNKALRRICIVLICFLMVGLLISGCRQQEKTELPINKEPVQEVITHDSTQKENLTGTTDKEPESNNGSTNTKRYNEQMQESSEVYYIAYQSGPDFIRSIVNLRGNVHITDDMRESFNLFARDYRWCYMPDMDGYESFFETTHYADTFGYPNFADAVFYVLQYMKCPEKMSDEAMQYAVQNLFVSKSSSDKEMANYEDMPHQAYRKIANYEDSYYSPWPEGGLDHNRMFYLLTAMDIEQEGAHVAYITVRARSYYFNDPTVYEMGGNEKWLAEKSKEMEIPDLQAATKLIASGEMKGIEGHEEFETTIYVKFSGQNPHGLNPRFLFSRSRDIAYDEPFSDK